LIKAIKTLFLLLGKQMLLEYVLRSRQKRTFLEESEMLHFLSLLKYLTPDNPNPTKNPITKLESHQNFGPFKNAFSHHMDFEAINEKHYTHLLQRQQ